MTFESMAARAELLFDLGPTRVVGHDADGEPIYRGAGLLTQEQVTRLMNTPTEESEAT